MERDHRDLPKTALDQRDRDLESLAALGDPIRRALYRHVLAQPNPVSRDQAASALGIARHTAKFHLDRLVAEGLLDVEFARPPGRTGPGAGRPAKLFLRASREVAVSVPDRRYDLAGQLLAAAVVESQRRAIPVGDALTNAALERGRAIADDVRKPLGLRPTRATLRSTLTAVLHEAGYEPQPNGRMIDLTNCPFHALATRYTDLVCGMNLDLLTGLVDNLGDTGLEARLDPAPGRCCVRIALTTRAR